MVNIFILVIFWTGKTGNGRKIAALMKPSVFQMLLYFVILSNTVELKKIIKRLYFI